MPSLASYQAFWASRSITFQPQPEMVFGARLAGGAAAAEPARNAAASPMAMSFMMSPLLVSSRSDRCVASDGGAVHDAQVAVVAALGVVHGAAVVPHHDHAGAPLVAVDEALLEHVLVEAAQDRVGLGRRHPLDADRVDRRDEEGFPPRDR